MCAPKPNLTRENHSKAYKKKIICGKFQLCISTRALENSKNWKSDFCQISRILVHEIFWKKSEVFLLSRHMLGNCFRFLNWKSKLWKIENCCLLEQLQSCNYISTASAYHCYYCLYFFSDFSIWYASTVLFNF